MLAIWRVWKSSKHCSGVNDMAEQHEKALVPQIRFTGFTDPWEQRKLEDYVVVSTAKNVDGRFNKEDVLSVSGEYGIVNQIAFQGRSFAGSSVLNYGIVNTGDIVYTKSPLNSNPYGIIKVNKGIPGIVSTLYAVYRPQDNVHTNFIQVYFEQHERMNNYMHPLVNKGAKNDMKVTAENALKGVVTFPSREEQVIISEFFDRLDSLITLHQRKYDKLCVLKKSMLDKMFPKGGSLYPEIRFAGFTDPWEQRKLGELFEEHSEKDRDDLPALTIIQGGGTVHRDESNRNLQFDRNSLSNYKVVDTGDFIVHLRSFEGGLEKATCCGLVSPAYHIFRGKNVDSDFYYLYFRSKRFIDADLKPHVYGIRDGRSIDIEGMKTIFIPWTNLAEQRRIGAFFDRLDSLITLHQRKLELLRNIKKSMLDEMFV
ncbi:restriction endonuclease subunit S [Bifidobacterium adolescentis]|nr:restriction endonuclease subunit S [Bifidobacterium adolescentis]KAB5671282.1 restriction endonuclease subunit S [Bifidobacterium adolescentis]